MKKLLSTIVITLIAAISFGQAKKDTKKDTSIISTERPTIQKMDTLVLVVFKPLEFDQFTKTLESLIDSKQTTKQVMDFILQRAQVVRRPADKPKQ